MCQSHAIKLIMQLIVPLIVICNNQISYNQLIINAASKKGLATYNDFSFNSQYRDNTVYAWSLLYM